MHTQGAAVGRPRPCIDGGLDGQRDSPASADHLGGWSLQTPER